MDDGECLSAAREELMAEPDRDCGLPIREARHETIEKKQA